jgi:hypothetical protein
MRESKLFMLYSTKKRLSRIFPEKAFYQNYGTKSIISFIWLGLQEVFHLLTSTIYLKHSKNQTSYRRVTEYTERSRSGQKQISRLA